MTEETKQTLNLPTAIVVGAVIIGIAIFASRGGSSNEPARALAFFDTPVEENNIDREDFIACLEDEDMRQRITDDLEEVVAVGGRGTPHSIIVGPDGSLYPVSGIRPLTTEMRGESPVPGFIEIIAGIRDGTTDIQPLSADVASNFRPVGPDDYVLGNPDASITIVEYSDFQCPYCADVHPVLEQLVQQDSDVRWAYRHFPLGNIHPQAAVAALASECIAELSDDGNEAFWEYADFIFKNPGLLQSNPYRG